MLALSNLFGEFFMLGVWFIQPNNFAGLLSVPSSMFNLSRPSPLQANSIGRSAKTVREFLEKNYTDEAIATDNEAIKLAIKALLEVG